MIHTHFYTANDMYITQLNLSDVSVVPSLSLCSAPPLLLCAGGPQCADGGLPHVPLQDSGGGAAKGDHRAQDTAPTAETTQSQFDKTEAARCVGPSCWHDNSLVITT